jgi:Flp pilus assembly protein TadD
LKGNYEEAEADLQRAAEKDPQHKQEVERECVANQHRARAAAQKQQQEFKNFFLSGR